MIKNIHVVMVETSHPGNIGAAARAMKNMGLSSMRLVKPKDFPCAEATSRAAGADDILVKAEVFETLEDAVSDCSLVMGTSARPRNLAWPRLDARQCAKQTVSESRRAGVALVFGRERTGLTNDELECCHYWVHIPCNEDYSSLNIAAAIQVVCYEVFMVLNQDVVVEDPHEAVSNEMMEGYYAHLEQVLLELTFLDPDHPRYLMRRLRRLYQRARPDLNEYNILRGILTAIQEKK